MADPVQDRTRAGRLIEQAEHAKANMGPDYGTNVTGMPSDEYKARIRAMSQQETNPPTRPVADTVRERAERDPAFREALEAEGVAVPKTTYWLRIDKPGQFTAGVRIRDGYVIGTAPRFDGMFPGWTEAELRKFAAGAGWTVEVANG